MTRKFNDNHEFINYIVELLKKSKVKQSDFFHSVTIAQACLETGYGRSDLFVGFNNAFGYKAKEGEWDGKTVDDFPSDEEIDGVKVEDVESDFRWYDTVQESVDDHANMMTSRGSYYVKRYQKAITATTPHQQAHALTNVYATDSDYGDKLTDIIDLYNLTRFDGIAGGKAPGASSQKKENENMSKPTYLFIAGHGPNKNNGYFDSGATGYISKGEHRYYKEDIFPKMKKYIPEGEKVVLFDAYNVYSQNNIVSLAKSYGPDTVVVECHYDATGNNAASGGHVIVYSGFGPDAIDLRLRDMIQNHIGLAYPVHKGHKGISGRNDLRNVNNTARGGVNYRLIELGFCTNRKDADYMVKNTEAIARDLVKAVVGYVKNTDPAEDKKDDHSNTKTHKVVHGDSLWSIGQKYGVTVEQIKEWNNLKSNLIFSTMTLYVENPDGKEPEKPIEEQPKDAEKVEEVEDKGETTPAVELKEGQLLDWQGNIYQKL